MSMATHIVSHVVAQIFNLFAISCTLMTLFPRTQSAEVKDLGPQLAHKVSVGAQLCVVQSASSSYLHAVSLAGLMSGPRTHIHQSFATKGHLHLILLSLSASSLSCHSCFNRYVTHCLVLYVGAMQASLAEVACYCAAHAENRAYGRACGR